MGLDNAALRGSQLGACLPNFSASAFWGFPVKPRKSPSSISAINPIYLSIYLTCCLSVCPIAGVTHTHVGHGRVGRFWDWHWSPVIAIKIIKKVLTVDCQCGVFTFVRDFLF